MTTPLCTKHKVYKLIFFDSKKHFLTGYTVRLCTQCAFYLFFWLFFYTYPIKHWQCSVSLVQKWSKHVAFFIAARRTYDVSIVNNGRKEAEPGHHWKLTYVWCNIRGLPWSIIEMNTISFHCFCFRDLMFIMSKCKSNRFFLNLATISTWENQALKIRLCALLVLETHLVDTGSQKHFQESYRMPLMHF